MFGYFDVKPYGWNRAQDEPYIHIEKHDPSFDDEVVLIEQDEYISDEGYRVLMAAEECGEPGYTLDDACERFFDEIDVLQGDICEIERQWQLLTEASIRDPLSVVDFDKKIHDLKWRLEFKEETKALLERDVGILLGRATVPF